MNKTKPFLVNAAPEHRFAELANLPETQLVMLVPARLWARLPEHISAYEAVRLAGRFGANPGEYEWEWLADAGAVRWWRRNAEGRESLFGMVVGVPSGERVELYGMVDVDERSPFWPDVIPEEAAYAMPQQAKLLAREKQRPEAEVLAGLYRDYFRAKGMLTTDRPGMTCTRRGTIREVERFQAALLALLERAGRTAAPSPADRRPR